MDHHPICHCGRVEGVCVLDRLSHTYYTYARFLDGRTVFMVPVTAGKFITAGYCDAKRSVYLKTKHALLQIHDVACEDFLRAINGGCAEEREALFVSLGEWICTICRHGS